MIQKTDIHAYTLIQFLNRYAILYTYSMDSLSYFGSLIFLKTTKWIFHKIGVFWAEIKLFTKQKLIVLSYELCIIAAPGVLKLWSKRNFPWIGQFLLTFNFDLLPQFCSLFNCEDAQFQQNDVWKPELRTNWVFP